MPHPRAEPGTSVRIPVDNRRFPWIRRLAVDYAVNFPRLAQFFAGDPTDPSAWPAAVERVRAHERPRAAITDVLSAQLARRNAPPEAMASVGRLSNPDTVAVLTGQQAGLFGGPLYTLLKALTAVSLAEHLSNTLRVRAVPIFWIDAEDHDWDEVRWCQVLDVNLQTRRLALPESDGLAGRPVARVRLSPAIEHVLDELAASLQPTAFTPEVLAELRRAYRPGMGMADAFGRLLDRVLGVRGLVVCDSSDPALKPFAAPVFVRELEQPGQTAALAAAAGDALVRLGYHAQVTPPEDAVALFRLDGAREPIRRRGADLYVGETFSSARSLQEEAGLRPTGFSPNVLLRPIVQDTLFPTACYVAGPSELAYLAQLRRVYDLFEVPMPLIHPRISATIVDSATARFLTRYEVALESLEPDDEAALNRLLESQLPPGVEASLNVAARTVQDAMAAVIAAVPAMDPTLEGAARTTLVRMENELRSLHSKIIQAAKRRDETLRRQFTRARAQAFPGGVPQERALGIIYFLNKYGPGLIDRLNSDLPLELGRHWVVTL